MKLLPGVALVTVLGLCLGFALLEAKGGRPMKDCTDALFEWRWIANCQTTFDVGGTDDIGGEKGDKLKTVLRNAGHRLVWWITGKVDLKIDFREFTNITNGQHKAECPGNFSVDGVPVPIQTLPNAETACNFLVSDKASLRKVKLISSSTGQTYKFTIMLTPAIGVPTPIDPELEIDTAPGGGPLINILTALLALVVVAAVGLTAYLLWRRAR